MLPLAGNPQRAQAEACELACHKLLVPPLGPVACGSEMVPRAGCLEPSSDRSGYARCLDGCPGARAVDGSSCPEPPLPGLVCEETSRANADRIIGGVIVVGALLLLVGAVVAIASLPPLLTL